MGLGDWRTSEPGDFRTAGETESGPPPVGEPVTVTLDPIDVIAEVVDPAVIVDGPIVVSLDPIDVVAYVVDPFVRAGGGDKGYHAILETVGL